MGRTSNITKKLEELSNQFKPQELNEENVQAIFNRCLKTTATKDIEYATLFRKEFGYERTENPVHFDKDIIKQNIQTIKYLYGQLNLVHEGLFSINSDNGRVKYDATQWSQNKGFLMEFFHLGAGAHIMGPFIADGQKASLIKLKPTLSPKDPNFPAWWEEHKSEWEEPKKEGKEPADD